MFKDCARLERNVFMTREECDVDEQDVDERKECWERKRVLSHICYERIKTEQGWSSNQFAVNASEFSV